MDSENINIAETEDFFQDKGMTPYQVIEALGRKNSKVLNFSQEDSVKFRQLYDEISKGNLLKGDKGKKLEELTSLLFSNPTGSFLNVEKIAERVLTRSIFL